MGTERSRSATGRRRGGGGRRLGFFVEEDADGVGVVTSLGMTSSSSLAASSAAVAMV